MHGKLSLCTSGVSEAVVIVGGRGHTVRDLHCWADNLNSAAPFLHTQHGTLTPTNTLHTNTHITQNGQEITPDLHTDYQQNNTHTLSTI